ncbi:F-box/kelch-repeat protein At3g23880-like [Vicia villosa]|uniref:F-box/kelch-repeat protein At3g23880-like n=1 Tax=Vicia villosa TaxID=3911 RepID=UPI00273AD09A|nr:F-box/kelch-repeat protein At3g23880-like [Vicia villosa]
MNLIPTCHRRSPVYLPEELIAEVLSILPVKSLLQLRCVSKSWKSLISNPIFVKQHLNRSTRNANLTLVSSFLNEGVAAFCLLEKPPITVNLSYDPYHQLKDKDHTFVIGSCNGLICFLGLSFFNEHTEMRLRVWNPATRAISEKLGFSSYDNASHPPTLIFGYDDSTGTYKVAYFISHTTQVRVFSLGHNVWRNIQNSPLDHDCIMNVVQLSGSFIWLANHNYIGKKIVIVSLNLGTEIHTQLLPPPSFDDEPIINPNLSVLKDCLCFSHDFNQTHFVIWQMKEFGVEDSWTQFLKISYRNNLQIDCPFNEFRHNLLPLCLLEKNDTLLLTDAYQRHIILYNWRDNRVKRINQSWPFHNYVESLVWYC